MMDLSYLFKGEHAMIDQEKLVPLYLLSDEQLAQVNLSLESLEIASELLEVEMEDLYYDPESTFQPFCYWDGLFYYRFITLQEEALQMKMGETYTLVDHFNIMQERFMNLIEEGEWNKAIFLSDKKVSFLVFEALKNEIPEEDQKDLFLEIYQRNEYGFNRLNVEMVKEILSLPTSEKYDVKHHEVKPDKEGYYTIYRGITPESTPVEQAYSWTFDRKTADFFANRFNSNGQIVEGKVHISKIQAFLKGRGEEEVIIFPENVEIQSHS